MTDYATDEGLRRALRQLPRERAGDDFTARVLERLPAPRPAAEVREGSEPWLVRPWAALAAGATLAVTAILTWSLIMSPGAGAPDPAREAARTGPAVETPVSAADTTATQTMATQTMATQTTDGEAPAGETVIAQTAIAQTVHAQTVHAQTVPRSARIASLIAEQRRLRHEVGELRRLVDTREPVLLLDTADGVGLLLPVGDTLAQPPGSGRAAPPPVRVVPARLTTY